MTRGTKEKWRLILSLYEFEGVTEQNLLYVVKICHILYLGNYYVSWDIVFRVLSTFHLPVDAACICLCNKCEDITFLFSILYTVKLWTLMIAKIKMKRNQIYYQYTIIAFHFFIFIVGRRSPSCESSSFSFAHPHAVWRLKLRWWCSLFAFHCPTIATASSMIM